MQGRSVPEVTLKTRIRDETVEGPNPFRRQEVQTGDLFSGRRAVVFSLPGAFMPTCSTEQCPAFERFYPDVKALGINDVGEDDDPYGEARPEPVLEWLKANPAG